MDHKLDWTPYALSCDMSGGCPRPALWKIGLTRLIFITISATTITILLQRLGSIFKRFLIKKCGFWKKRERVREWESARWRMAKTVVLSCPCPVESVSLRLSNFDALWVFSIYNICKNYSIRCVIALKHTKLLILPFRLELLFDSNNRRRVNRSGHGQRKQEDEHLKSIFRKEMCSPHNLNFHLAWAVWNVTWHLIRSKDYMN